jgi:regulator of chromosome condensation
MARRNVQKPKETVENVPEKVDNDAPPVKKARTVNKVAIEIPSLPTKSGNPLACGQNDVGQLGFNSDDVAEKTRPALVGDIKDIVDVQAGGMHSLCLTVNGEIYSFGCNDEGALGRDTSEEGSEMKPDKIQLPKKAVKISCGDSHSACLLEDGSVFAWGSFRDAHGSMGLTTEGKKQSPIQVLSEIVAVDIASGSDHFVVLANNGNVYTIGCGEQGQLGRASMRTLTGESRRGTKTLLTPGIITKKAKRFIANAIWATPYCTFLREAATGAVYGFGLNNFNQICVKKGKNEFEHFPVLTKMENVKQIAGGQHHTIVLTNDHNVYSIGRKEYGRLGLGAVKDDITALTVIDELKNKNIVSISCGAENSFGLSKDGKVYVWGSGTSSTLGTGDEDDVVTPKLLASAQIKGKNILAVSGGGQHSLFLAEEARSTPAAEKPEPVKASKKAAKDTAAKTNGTAEKEKTPASVVSDDKEKTPMEVDPVPKATDVNGNDSKEQKTENATKRSRKRKA